MNSVGEIVRKIKDIIELTAREAVEDDVRTHYAPPVIKAVAVTPGGLRCPDTGLGEPIECTDEELGEALTLLVKEGLLEVEVEGESIYLKFPLDKLDQLLED